MVRRRSSAAVLAALFAALVAYASLFPFRGWRWPGGVEWLAYLSLPWPRYWTAFDLVANLVGYVPLGLLIFVAGRRQAHSRWLSVGAGVLMPLTLSLALETLQNALPHRVPSNVDVALNAGGALAGSMLGLILDRLGWIRRWHGFRAYWWRPRSALALALLLLWPLGLLFPLPAPLGMGQALLHGRDALLSALQGSALASMVSPDWFVTPLSGAVTALGPDPLPMAHEFAITCLGFLSACLVCYSVARPGWRRAVLSFLAAVLAVAASMASTALNFGPEHALAWFTPVSSWALGVGLILAWGLVRVSFRAAAVLALMSLVAQVVLVNQAPSDPYFALSLQGWEQGRFIQFFGASQWVGWLWPFAALAHCLVAALGSAPPDEDDEPAT